jgi:replicative DNA helicase
MIIVDYLQLMSHTRRVDNRQQEIAEISRGLKMLAKELEIPVVAVSSSTAIPNAAGQASAALGPARVRRDRAGRRRGDVHPPRRLGPRQEGLADLIVAKHRNGPTDTVPLTFLPHLTQFRNHATAVT